MAVSEVDLDPDEVQDPCIFCGAGADLGFSDRTVVLHLCEACMVRTAFLRCAIEEHSTYADILLASSAPAPVPACRACGQGDEAAALCRACKGEGAHQIEFPQLRWTLCARCIALTVIVATADEQRFVPTSAPGRALLSKIARRGRMAEALA